MAQVKQAPILERALEEATDEGWRARISWRSAFILSLGGIVLVTVSLGSMAGAIGVASLLAWGVTAVVGLLLCLLLAELAEYYPHKLGGAPAYVHEGLQDLSSLWGALAAWSYWIAWIPGVAVNSMLAALYLQATFLPRVNVFVLVLLLLVLLYTLNSFGLRIGTRFSFAVALCALVPLCIILLAPLFHPSLWQSAHFHPFFPPSAGTNGMAIGLHLVKWMFVAAWSSYGAEMSATVVGELRHPRREGAKAILSSAILGVLAFTLMPLVLLALVGVAGLTQDPCVVFFTAAADIFGPLGADIIRIMLIAVLLLGAEMFIVSSSRARYQMSLDGLTLKGFGKVNRYGAPTGSMVGDALVTFTLLAIFQGNIVNVVATANVGYLLVFLLVPLAYWRVKRKQTGEKGVLRLPGFFMGVTAFLALFNGVLLLVGGMQWGAMVMGIGLGLVVLFLPFYMLRRRVAHVK